MNFSENNLPTLCSVCVPTYRRPFLLKKLLKSLEAQKLPEHVCLEIIVVDNDPNHTAKPVVAQFQDSGRIQFRYFTQPKKNISLTRNLSVEKAPGQFILFIDDDEKASSKWVANMFYARQIYGADGVIGKMQPDFHESAPSWVRHEDFYYSPMTATGTVAKFLYAGNCFIKASLIKNKKTPFNINYGLTGSEDAHLFESLVQAGAYFINCQEAVATEFIPPERTTLRFFFKRGMRGGNGHTRRVIERAGKNVTSVRLFMFAKSLILGVTSLGLFILLYPNKYQRIKWLLRFGSNWGRFLAVVNRRFQGYH
jgi:succinoglycan biosynthesis protein ExoM